MSRFLLRATRRETKATGTHAILRRSVVATHERWRTAAVCRSVALIAISPQVGPAGLVRNTMFLAGAWAVCGLMLWPSSATRAADCRPRLLARGAVAEGSLVVVPFAIPVAVPVATIQRPTLFYSYQSQAQVARPPAVQSHSPEKKPETSESSMQSGGQGDADGGGTEDRLPLSAESVLRRRCVKCHGGGEVAGGLAFVTDDGRLVDRLPRQWMFDMVEQGRMPPQQVTRRPTSEEIELLRAWAKPPKDLRY